MDIGKLFELQKLDLNLEKARRKLAQLKQALGESDELGSARKSVADTEAELHRWHTAQKNAELESQALAQQIDGKDKELMSGRVSNPKELEALQANVEALRRQQSTVEDTGMDALLHVEALNQQLATAQESLRQIEDKWNGSQADLLQEDAKYKRIYAQLKQQRDTLAQSLPPADLKYYEDLRTRKAGIAISPLQNGQCGVCHILVPTGVVSAARSRKNEAVTCPSCGRVLFAG
ncbi:MAG: C4-type zinc ribbon domain-containing protein [Caldilineaceae bacterium]